jgi:F-type H+-transporting ATPase subunit b
MKRTSQRNGLTISLVVSVVVCLLLVVLAAVGFASEGGEGAHHVDTARQLKDFGWRVLDFGALLALVIWALKKVNVKGTLAARQASIDKALQEAADAKEAAEKKFAEYSAKLAAANKEIDEIYTAIRTEGEAEKVRIIAEARVTAEKIKEQAAQAANQEVFRARTELRAEAVRLAVELAEQSIREKIVQADQDRLVGEYLTKVVELH